MATHVMKCGACGGEAPYLSPKRPKQTADMRCDACLKAERERDMAALREVNKDTPSIPFYELTVAGRRARGIDT